MHNETAGGANTASTNTEAADTMTPTSSDVHAGHSAFLVSSALSASDQRWAGIERWLHLSSKSILLPIVDLRAHILQ